MTSLDSETAKLLETPKTTNYDLCESKDTEKERVIAFLSLPSEERGAVIIFVDEQTSGT
jgi:hypothetical protein